MTDTQNKFKEYLNKLAQYEQVIALLQWDLKTAAPENGTASKIEALSFFSTEYFRLMTAEEFGSLLKALSAPEEFDSLNDAMKITVTRYFRDYQKSKNIPEDFFTEYVNASAHSEQAWEAAKRASDYSIFLPHLQKMIDMTKQKIAFTDPGKEIYDVLLDTYEEGMDSATIDRLFEEVKKELVPLLQKIKSAPEPDSSIFNAHYDIDSQKHLQDFLLSYIGFSHKSGNTAESEHPFTLSLGLGDSRVTNHYSLNDPISAIFSAIHEGGHAIFEQNINPSFEKTAAASVNLLGLHESQSRFYENILGRNIHFWEPIYEKLGEFLPKFKEISLEDFFREINHVKCSFIRTEADELTYPFHIILRYEIEKAIFREGVTADKLPELWNQKMEEMLGIVPSNDAEGILQDMHWSDGSFGYFPTYLLGTIYDGMFLEQIEKELGSLDSILAEGRISQVTKWLNENIHQYGSLYTSKEVIQRVCSREISAEPIIRYFKEKYSKIYNL